jgi:hypothetical protein
MGRASCRGALLSAGLVAAGLSAVAMPVAPATAHERAHKRRRAVITRSAALTVAPNGATANVTAHCPRHTNLLSGGFSGEYGGGAIDVFESRRVNKRNWRVAGSNGATVPRKLTAHAYCRRGAPLLKQINVGVRMQATPAPSNILHVEADCLPGQFALSGGFIGPIFGVNPNGSILTYGSYRPTPTSWGSSVVALGPSGQFVEYGLFVYCMRKRLVRRTASATVSPGDANGASTPACRQALSGGYEAEQPVLPPGNLLQVVSSGLDGSKRWKAAAYQAGNTTGTITSYAYCGR